MCFVWIWEQTAIISLYGTDWLVFVTETKCFLTTNQIRLSVKHSYLFLCHSLYNMFRLWHNYFQGDHNCKSSEAYEIILAYTLIDVAYILCHVIWMSLRYAISVCHFPHSQFKIFLYAHKILKLKWKPICSLWWSQILPVDCSQHCSYIYIYIYMYVCMYLHAGPNRRAV